MLRSLRTHSDAAAIALPNPAARTQLSFLSWTFVLCPSLAGTSFSSSSFLRHALPRQLARTPSAARLATPARTRAPRAHERRPATNDTTCGPPEWLTGKLQQGGTRSVRSPPRRPPLLATPIATPLSLTLRHARSFLSCLGPLSFVLLWPALFLLLFCGTPCHASSRARFPRRVSPHQHARARRARTDDAQRRTIRRAVRRSG